MNRYISIFVRFIRKFFSWRPCDIRSIDCDHLLLYIYIPSTSEWAALGNCAGGYSSVVFNCAQQFFFFFFLSPFFYYIILTVEHELLSVKSSGIRIRTRPAFRIVVKGNNFLALYKYNPIMCWPFQHVMRETWMCII